MPRNCLFCLRAIVANGAAVCSAECQRGLAVIFPWLESDDDLYDDDEPDRTDLGGRPAARSALERPDDPEDAASEEQVRYIDAERLRLRILAASP